jgi:MoaA/NifB/PqqE/SkfB family radical SAM enzyme
MGEHKNISLIVSAGKGCFTVCRGCYQSFGHGIVTTESLIAFIKQYKDYFNINKVTLSGGDPLSRPDIVSFVNSIFNLGVSINLDTVGLPFIKSVRTVFHQNVFISRIDPSSIIDKICCIGIPLDGFDTASISYFRKGITLEETISIISILNDNKANICINTVVHKHNMNELFSIWNLIKGFDHVVKWQLFQYTPIGINGYKNRKYFEISEIQFEEVCQGLIDRIGNCSVFIEKKSNSYRKLAYVLVDCEGRVWQPKCNTSTSYFTQTDISPDIKVIGSISDRDIMIKIESEIDY